MAYTKLSVIIVIIIISFNDYPILLPLYSDSKPLFPNSGLFNAANGPHNLQMPKPEAQQKLQGTTEL